MIDSKYFCDICKKEIKDITHSYKIKIELNSFSLLNCKNNEIEHREICINCRNTIKECIKNLTK